jgi:hypothetical protein
VDTKGIKKKKEGEKENRNINIMRIVGHILRNKEI